ncbi:hypothetical protein ACLMJK_000689 [Lecanora helva]
MASQESARASDGNEVDYRIPLLNKSRPEPITLSKNISLLLQDWWLWELCSALLATLSTTAIIVVLVRYDGSPLPDWPSVITLNSVISLLAVVSKLAFTTVVGASISQAKWLWFRQDEPRPLQDLQVFDDATRGPWGALALLIKLKARYLLPGCGSHHLMKFSDASSRHLAFVGATITILLLLFDPFLQQVVVYPDRLVPSDKVAAIARAQGYQARSNEGLPLPSVVDMSMKASIYSGIFDVDDHADVLVDHVCPTGNCTWVDFSSLAVCSKCANITSYVERSCDATGCHRSSLAGGPSLVGSGGQINSSITDISPELVDVEASIIQFSSLLSKPMDTGYQTSAWECVMFYCINQYSASVTDGTIKQHISQSWRNDSASHSIDSDLWYKPPFGGNSTFKVASIAAKAMNSFMSTTFTGSGGINSTTSGSAFSSDVVHALYDTVDYSDRIENLAVSMSNNIRQQNDGNSSPFKGLAYQSETYVKVRWPWFSYPATLVLASLLYLFGTIVETTYRDVLIWKSYNMVMLFHGQNLDLYDPRYVPVTEVSQMREMFTGVNVGLVQTENDSWKLVQRPVK